MTPAAAFITNDCQSFIFFLRTSRCRSVSNIAPSETMCLRPSVWRPNYSTTLNSGLPRSRWFRPVVADSKSTSTVSESTRSSIQGNSLKKMRSCSRSSSRRHPNRAVQVRCCGGWRDVRCCVCRPRPINATAKSFRTPGPQRLLRLGPPAHPQS